MITGQLNVKADKDEPFQNSNHISMYFNYLRKIFMLKEIMHKILFYAIKTVSNPHLSPGPNLNSLQWSKFTYFLQFL